MSDIKQEKFINKYLIQVSLDNTNKIVSQMKNCICKIYKKGGTATGFFCKIPFNNDFLPVLITNNHVINDNDISNNICVDLSINNSIKKKIKIDNSRKKYTNSEKNIDITIIEIKPEDGIINFLEVDGNIYKDIFELEYSNELIYIIHYPKGELSISYGLIKEINDKKKNTPFL